VFICWIVSNSSLLNFIGLNFTQIYAFFKNKNPPVLQGDGNDYLSAFFFLNFLASNTWYWVAPFTFKAFNNCLRLPADL